MKFKDLLPVLMNAENARNVKIQTNATWPRKFFNKTIIGNKGNCIYANDIQKCLEKGETKYRQLAEKEIDFIYPYCLERNTTENCVIVVCFKEEED